jgi:CBS domain-containing protein
MRRRSRGTESQSAAADTGVVDMSCCVAEVMGTELFTLTPDTVVGSALRLAHSKRIRHFLVIEDGSLTGIVCQNDLRQARESSLVGECMSSPVLCIGPETTVKEAADIMSENSVRCLPVVTGAFLVGVITWDGLEGMGASLDAESDDEEDGDDLLTEEDAEAEEFDKTCAACGSSKEVRKDVRAGLMPLCVECTAVIPAAEPLRGN